VELAATLEAIETQHHRSDEDADDPNSSAAALDGGEVRVIAAGGRRPQRRQRRGCCGMFYDPIKGTSGDRSTIIRAMLQSTLNNGEMREWSVDFSVSELVMLHLRINMYIRKLHLEHTVFRTVQGATLGKVKMDRLEARDSLFSKLKRKNQGSACRRKCKHKTYVTVLTTLCLCCFAFMIWIVTYDNSAGDMVDSAAAGNSTSNYTGNSTASSTSFSSASSSISLPLDRGGGAVARAQAGMSMGSLNVTKSSIGSIDGLDWLPCHELREYVIELLRLVPCIQEGALARSWH
jgi:hypothetical protein